MAMYQCRRCDTWIDGDWNPCIEVEAPNHTPEKPEHMLVCGDCLTEEESE